MASVSQQLLIASGSVAAPFVPTDLGTSVLNAWFDFSATGTITASGGAVSQVTDKSGNGNILVQSTGASKPTTAANTLNSLNVLTFDGGDVLEQTASLVYPPMTGGVTIVAVRKYTSGTGGGIFWASSQAGTFGDVYTLGRDGGVMGAWGDRTNDATATGSTFSDSDNTNWNISSAFYQAASRQVFHNGTAQTGNSSGVTVNAIDHVFLGQCLSRNRGAGRFITGQIAEIFIAVGIGATNRQKLEGYTAWKWGLQASLDAGHPYKSAAP